MSPESLQEDLLAEHRPAGTARHAKQPGVAKVPIDVSQNEEVVVFKFGGTSLLGAERMLHAARLVRDAAKTSRVTVVVSAMKGVTDHLLQVGHHLGGGHRSQARKKAETVVQLHSDVLRDLQLPRELHDRIHRELQLLGRDLLFEVPLQGSVQADAALLDRLASFGERFCSRLFAAALARLGVPAVPVASSDFVLTCDNFSDAKPHLEHSKQRGRDILLPLLEDDIVPVVTGFIGATPDGRITTLGRNSSDFSGAIVAYIVDADELVIWTDVDGIYTTNPHESVEAKLLNEMSYEAARALVAGGAKVLHPLVLPLAAETALTVWVRNTFRPHVRGTRIGKSRPRGGA